MDKKGDGYFEDNRANWEFLRDAYAGVDALVKNQSVLARFEQGPNYDRVKREAYGECYSEQIVNLLADIISEKPFDQEFGQLSEDELFATYLTDCDFRGTDYDIFWARARRLAGLYGHCGVLTDRPTGQGTADAPAYAYHALYSPLNILEVAEEIDPETHRPRIARLKVFDDSGHYRLWTPEKIETAIEVEGELEPVSAMSGANPLGYVPFRFLSNNLGANQRGGKSDIQNIAKIDASLIMNLTSAEQLIFSGAFPMLLLPESGARSDVRIGPNEALTFPDEFPESKPDWLRPAVKEPIEAILEVLRHKENRIYELAGMSGIIAAAAGKDAHSGDALEQYFRFLSARLANKAHKEAEARRNCLADWCAWEGKTDKAAEIQIGHDGNFQLDRWMVTIADILTGKTLFRSSATATAELLARAARKVLPGASEEVLAAIREEVEQGGGAEAGTNQQQQEEDNNAVEDE